MCKIKSKLVTVFVTTQVLFFNTPAEGGAVGDSKIATGTEALIKDATTWLMILAPIVGGLLVIYFFYKKKWSRRTRPKTLE